MVTINIEKRHLFLLTAVFVFLVGVGLVIGYVSNPGAVPNPGHSLSQIQGYFQGDSNLQTSLGKFLQSCTVRQSDCYATGWIDLSAGGFPEGCKSGYYIKSLDKEVHSPHRTKFRCCRLAIDCNNEVSGLITDYS